MINCMCPSLLCRKTAATGAKHACLGGLVWSYVSRARPGFAGGTRCGRRLGRQPPTADGAWLGPNQRLDVLTTSRSVSRPLCPLSSGIGPWQFGALGERTDGGRRVVVGWMRGWDVAQITEKSSTHNVASAPEAAAPPIWRCTTSRRTAMVRCRHCRPRYPMPLALCTATSRCQNGSNASVRIVGG